ncbi:MAG: hypothetical protein L0G46_06950 [Kocuria sp.]|nr:hypothetical protein [Kocuria sp.]
MNQSDPVMKSARRQAIVPAVAAVLFLVMAIWTASKGDVLEATGHMLVVILAAAAAFLVSNPRRPRETQLRITIGGLALVPIILTIFIVALFV